MIILLLECYFCSDIILVFHCSRIIHLFQRWWSSHLLPLSLYALLSLVQLVSQVWLFVTPWTAARQSSLSITNSWSLLKFVSIKSVMPFNHLNHHYTLPVLQIIIEVRSWKRSYSSTLSLLQLRRLPHNTCDSCSEYQNENPGLLTPNPGVCLQEGPSVIYPHQIDV